MIVVPMNEAHVRAIRPQQAQSVEASDVERRVREATALAATGAAWAAIDDGGVLALAGVSSLWEGRGMAWCLLSDHAATRMVSLTRGIGRYLDGVKCRRLEMYVDAGFVAGRRWAEMLGFRNETPEGMKGFMPNGNNAYLYARVRSWHG